MDSSESTPLETPMAPKAAWLTEKAKNKEFGEWMQVTRQKKNQAVASGESARLNPLPRSSNQQPRPPRQTTQRTQIQPSNGSRPTPGPAVNQSNQRTQARNPNGRVLPSSILRRENPGRTNAQTATFNPHTDGFNFHTGSTVVSTSRSQNFTTQNPFGILTDQENTPAAKNNTHGSGTMGSETRVRPVRVRDDVGGNRPNDGKGHRDTPGTVATTLSDITNQADSVTHVDSGNSTHLLGGRDRSAPSRNGSLESRQILAENITDTVGAGKQDGGDGRIAQTSDVDMDGSTN
ncbi:hypothetical protein OROMI_030547 [Orobanche minor]